MNWRLIFKLSIFGLAMGIGTVFFISSKVEPWLWLVIFVICAYVLAHGRTRRSMMHGILLGLTNSIWITASHVVFSARYLSTHAREAAMSRSMPLPEHPRLMMALVGPLIGLLSGAVLGLLTLLTAAILRKSHNSKTKSRAFNH